MEEAHKKLIVWQRADEFAYRVYIATKNFPREEIYGITSQLRRAALSVALNIVEGYARQSQRQLKHFLQIALGSLAEAEYLLDFSWRLGYFSAENFKDLDSCRQEVGSLLWKFYINL
jgi:four helix bundle protein